MISSVKSVFSLHFMKTDQTFFRNTTNIVLSQNYSQHSNTSLFASFFDFDFLGNGIGEDEENDNDKFNYEPDEQKKEIQEKSIQPIIKTRTWSSFHNEFKHTSLYTPSAEIFEKLNVSILKY